MTPTPPENFFQFEKLLAEIARAAVDFAVVGGVAVSLNGFVRATDDVDILIKEDRPNVEKLLSCLIRWGEGWARELKPDEFIAQEGSIRVMEDFDLDICAATPSTNFAHASAFLTFKASMSPTSRPKT